MTKVRQRIRRRGEGKKKATGGRQGAKLSVRPRRARFYAHTPASDEGSWGQ
jgi:hypothetical protein